MSKMDNLRAMREARYEKAAAAGRSAAATGATKKPAAAPVAPRPATRPVPPARVPVDDVTAEPEEAAEEALCGHRNMSGRTCTREKGHAAKSHRYS